MTLVRSAALAVALLAVGCTNPGLSEEQEFRQGVPRSDAANLAVPGSGSGAQKSGPALKGEGQTAFLYQVTRGTTQLLNGGTALVLGIVRTIVDGPPTSIEGDVAVWGPYSDALSPNAWRLTVTRTAEHHYSYVLEGKAKTAPDSAYVTVLSGTHTPALTVAGNEAQRHGEGTFFLDWNEAQNLPEHGGEHGTVTVTYSRMSATSPTSIEMELTAVHGNATSPITATYQYNAAPGEGGEFTFVGTGDVDSANDNTAAETLAVHSRWLETGAGRADARASGGDLSGEALASECWGTAFQSTFFAFNAFTLWGVEASDCVFTSAEFSP